MMSGECGVVVGGALSVATSAGALQAVSAVAKQSSATMRDAADGEVERAETEQGELRILRDPLGDGRVDRDEVDGVLAEGRLGGEEVARSWGFIHGDAVDLMSI